MTRTHHSAETEISVVSDLEVTLSRIFDAPRELVYQASTQPQHMTQWWGPRGMAMPVCEMDVRPGGTYRFVQRDPEGHEHVFFGEFREVSPPERLVMTQVYEPYREHELLVEITFEALEAGRTRLYERMLFDTVESRDGMIAAGMESGARESMDRLAELLATLRH